MTTRDRTFTITITIDGEKLNSGQTITIQNIADINQWKTAEDIFLGDFSSLTSQGGATISQSYQAGTLTLEIVGADIGVNETIQVTINQIGASDFWIGDTNSSQSFTVERTDNGANATFSMNINTPEYQLRDRGPAGGYIFYIDEAGNFDWKYLEAALRSTEESSLWGSSEQVDGTSSNIGEGKNNTDLILDSENTGTAAVVARQVNQGGYNDWFLPSLDEVIEMYNELHSNGVGDFLNSAYWSSYDYLNPDFSFSINGLEFTNGNVYTYIKNQNSNRIRAIRSF